MIDESADNAGPTINEKLDQLLAEIAKINARLEASAKYALANGDLIKGRTERIEESLTAAHTQLRAIDRKLEIFNAELLKMKVDLRDFEERLAEIERRPD